MTEMYGHRWTSQQGEEPNDTWIRGLVDINPVQLGCGLVSCRDSADGWPPTLPEFRAKCTGDDGQGWERQAHKLIDSTAKLEDKTAKEKRCADGLAQIRKLRQEVGI